MSAPPSLSPDYPSLNNNKRMQTKKPNTIDEKHTELMDLFENDEKIKIPSLMGEIRELKKSLLKFENDEFNPIVASTLTSKTLKHNNITGNIDKYLDIKDQIIDKKRKIRDLKNRKKKYFLENSKCIFYYFEHKKDISIGGGNQNTNILNNFFKIKSANNTDEDIYNNDKYRTSKYIYHNYWKNVNNEILNIKDYAIVMDTCHYCNNGEFIHQEDEGILICNNSNCGKFIVHIVDSSKPSNKEPPNEISYTAYIRLNHFKEILSQFQAKETTQIPSEIIEMIRARIKKERITDLSKLNYDKMRDILRKLGLNKYFEHIQYINSIFGVKPPVMSELLIETLCVLFIEIQPKFSIYCPANRTNFLAYGYILHQLCVLLDQKQYLPYITTLKDIEKQRQNDAIWYLICKSLDWQYFPTI